MRAVSLWRSMVSKIFHHSNDDPNEKYCYGCGKHMGKKYKTSGNRHSCPNTVFCSPSCQNIYRHKVMLKEGKPVVDYTFNCLNCKKTITLLYNRLPARKPKFCSPTCARWIKKLKI